MVLNKDGKISNQQTISFTELADSVTFSLRITPKLLQLMTYITITPQSLAEV
jgi:hypothetical protein